MEENKTMMLDDELKNLIDQLVEEKVNAKLQNFQQELTKVQSSIKSFQNPEIKEKVTLLITSYELDQVMPAFIVASGAASFGMEVSMFFTLWGINVLKEKSIYKGKKIKEKMISFMLPSNPNKTIISRMNMMGIGTEMMKQMMKESNVESLPSLMNLAAELDVKMTACQMTMGIMGVTREELRQDVSYGGVAAYIEDAAESKVTLSF